MGLFDVIFGDNQNRENLDDYGLEAWQREEVKKGNYSPWNFEEEELEEDDYYEDDLD